MGLELKTTSHKFKDVTTSFVEELAARASGEIGKMY